MVVGNGMLAKAFKMYENNGDVVIFASGVSNSKEENIFEYKRELSLLKKYINSKKIIYFSTISIFDESLSRLKYISHKLEVEKFIKENWQNYIIFRLPNVVGKSENTNTSFNFFKDKILKNEEIQIQKNAIRYFIDVDDLSNILPIIISKETKKTINVCFDNKIFITEMILFFEELLKIKAKKTLIEGGENYEIDNYYFMNIVKENNIIFNSEYNKNLIKKYLY